MRNLRVLFQNQYLQWMIIGVLIIYQTVRLIVFIDVYGGLEHDSGWFLGLARSLAETGSYTTMVSTIADSTPGGHKNIYGQYNVQDAAGRVYFFTESGVFAAGIIPNAIIIKLFGADFWQYRAGPLLFFVFGLLLVSYLLYRYFGVLSVLLINLFFLFYPHLIIFLGYEAMGEIFSLTYILLAFVLFMKAVQAKQHRLLWFLACGFSAGLAINTKPIAFLSLGGLILAWLLIYWKKGSSLREGFILGSGWVLVPILWELTQLVSLTVLFDFQTYQNHLAQRLDFFSNEGGSGLGARAANDLVHFLHKLLMTQEISVADDAISLTILLIILLSGPLLIWHNLNSNLQRSLVVLLFWGGWFIHSLWFVTFAQTGWMRHDWYALMFGVFLLSLTTAYAWQQVHRPLRLANLAIPGLLTSILLVGFVGQANTVSLWVSDKVVEHWHQKHLASERTRIPWSLVPRQLQQEAVDFIAKLPATGRIFYPEGHKSAEMAVLTGRILYPIERRPFMPSAEGDVIIVGPSLISPWTKLMERPMSQIEQQGLIDTVVQRIKTECSNIVFENSYYIICALD